MNTQKALNILIQAARSAVKKGAFELEEAKVVAEAVETFVTPLDENGTDKEKSKKDSKGQKDSRKEAK